MGREWSTSSEDDAAEYFRHRQPLETGESLTSAEPVWVRTLRRSVRAVSDVRSERIESLRARIEAGTYRISGRIVAAALIAELQRNPLPPL